MIKRIVRLTFAPQNTKPFEKIFQENKKYIRTFQGCKKLKLYRDIQNLNVYYTVSHWDSEADLENYRKSDLFIQTWAKTKVLFDDKPIAYSLEPIETID